MTLSRWFRIKEREIKEIVFPDGLRQITGDSAELKGEGWCDHSDGCINQSSSERPGMRLVTDAGNSLRWLVSLLKRPRLPHMDFFYPPFSMYSVTMKIGSWVTTANRRTRCVCCRFFIMLASARKASTDIVPIFRFLIATFLSLL